MSKPMSVCSVCAQDAPFVCHFCRETVIDDLIEQKLVAIRDALHDLRRDLEDLRNDHRDLRTEFDGTALP